MSFVMNFGFYKKLMNLNFVYIIVLKEICLKFLISKYMVVYVYMELGNIMLQNFIDNFLFVYDIVL